MLRHPFTFSIRIGALTDRVCCHICTTYKPFNVIAGGLALFVDTDEHDETPQYVCDDCAGQHVPQLAAMVLEARTVEPCPPYGDHGERFTNALAAWREVAEAIRADRKVAEVMAFVDAMENRGVLTVGERQDIIIAAGIGKASYATTTEKGA